MSETSLGGHHHCDIDQLIFVLQLLDSVFIIQWEPKSLFVCKVAILRRDVVLKMYETNSTCNFLVHLDIHKG
jgi:hypothetical protein